MENLPLIERVIAHVSRKGRLFGADAEDFASIARLALIQNDYAVLSRYDGRAPLAAYLAVVLHRLLGEERNRQYGRWRPSAEAKRMGSAGMLLEKLLRRDRRSLSEVTPIVASAERDLTEGQIEAMAERLPDREPRPRPVLIDDVPERAVAADDDAAGRVDEAERRRLGDVTERVLRNALGTMTPEDRVLLKMRFASSMKISSIARMLNVPQRPLYRRIEVLLEALRAAFAAAGIDGTAVSDLIGCATIDLDFGWSAGKTPAARPYVEEKAGE